MGVFKWRIQIRVHLWASYTGFWKYWSNFDNTWINDVSCQRKLLRRSICNIWTVMSKSWSASLSLRTCTCIYLLKWEALFLNYLLLMQVVLVLSAQTSISGICATLLRGREIKYLSTNNVSVDLSTTDVISVTVCALRRQKSDNQNICMDRCKLFGLTEPLIAVVSGSLLGVNEHTAFIHWDLEFSDWKWALITSFFSSLSLKQAEGATCRVHSLLLTLFFATAYFLSLCYFSCIEHSWAKKS